MSANPRANAELIERNLFSLFGNDKLVTIDTSTWLEWLDVDQTAGLSVNQVAADVGGWGSLGFSIAHNDEVQHLFEEAGIVDFSDNPSWPTTPVRDNS